MSEGSKSEAVAAVNRAEFGAAVEFARFGLPRRPVVPVLGGMLVTVSGGMVKVAAFDYETAAAASVACETAGEASVLVAGSELAAAVKGLPKGGQVTTDLAVTGGGLTIECDGITTRLPSLPMGEYPALPELPALSGAVDGAAFARAVKRVSACAGTDDTLPSLTCVQFTGGQCGGLELAATDRYRLGVDRVDWTGTDAVSVLVSAALLAKAAAKLDARGKVSLHIGDGLAGFTDGSRTLITRPDSGTFPRYRALIRGEHDTVVTVDAGRLGAAVTRAGKIAAKGSGTGFGVRDGGVTVSVTAGGEVVSSQTVTATHTGPDYDTGFSAVFLASVLAGFCGDVRIGLHTRTYTDMSGKERTSQGPAVFTAGGDTFTAVVVPLRPAKG